QSLGSRTNNQNELTRMHATGEYSISDLAELFAVSRSHCRRAQNQPHPRTPALTERPGLSATGCYQIRPNGLTG
ncbi:MAG: hypothetical protein ACKVK8_10805, partial [Rhodospirillales bacterium]